MITSVIVSVHHLTSLSELDFITFKYGQYFKKLGAIARSVAMLLGNQEAPQSILTSGTSFREDLFTKIFLLLLIQEEHLSVNGKMMCAEYW